MANNKDLAKYNFKKGFGPKRNTNGAPRKLISKIADLGYTYGEISSTILNIAAMTIDEIKQIAENEDCAALERLIAKSLIKDFSKGSLWNLETIISRAIGKPKETAQLINDNKIEIVFVKGKTIL